MRDQRRKAVLLGALRCGTHEIAWPGRVGQGLAWGMVRRGLVGRGAGWVARSGRSGPLSGGRWQSSHRPFYFHPRQPTYQQQARLPMHFLWIIIIGFVAGLIARGLAPGANNPSGFILTTVLGIAGAFVATYSQPQVFRSSALRTTRFPAPPEDRRPSSLEGQNLRGRSNRLPASS
jgi:uncharacterized membrane protein YeaQ/YmgE (transglycosylase-associated protein family)